MLISIIGCGALGGLIAAHLINKKFNIQVLQRDGAQLEALKQNGLTFIDQKNLHHVYQIPTLSSDSKDLKPSDLIIVTVKAYQTNQLHNIEQLLKPEGQVLSLQNGLGNVETLLKQLPKTKLVAGIGTYGAHKTRPGVVNWGGEGQIILGPLNNQTDISWIQNLFLEAGFKTEIVKDPKKHIWQKLALNAMINPITALTGFKNGMLVEHHLIKELMRNIGQETIVAASRAGVILDFDEIWLRLKKSIAATAVNKSSMLQDIEKGIKTEIDAISGNILEYANDEQEFPYTRSLYTLLKSIEAQKLR
jgi:2-dehydropantoate 2-reductase